MAEYSYFITFKVREAGFWNRLHAFFFGDHWSHRDAIVLPYPRPLLEAEIMKFIESLEVED